MNEENHGNYARGKTWQKVAKQLYILYNPCQDQNCSDEACIELKSAEAQKKKDLLMELMADFTCSGPEASGQNSQNPESIITNACSQVL